MAVLEKGWRQGPMRVMTPGSTLFQWATASQVYGFAFSPFGDSWSLVSFPYLSIHPGRIWKVNRNKIGKEEGERQSGREIAFAVPHGWRSLAHRQEELGSKPRQLPTAPHYLLGSEKLR